MSASKYRKAFEDATYKEYQMAEFAKFHEGAVDQYYLIPPQEFFKMKPNGTYKLEPLNFAYSGWNNAIAYILSTPVDEAVAAVDHF